METTWDRLPVSEEKPYGAAIIVFKKTKDETLFLILHRTHEGGPEYEGDWAWGPPAGARLPREPIEQCMKRELIEETGLTLDASLTEIGDEDWYIYYAEANPDAKVVLSEEHDQFRWLPVEEASVRCLPEKVGNQIRRVAAELLGL